MAVIRLQEIELNKLSLGDSFGKVFTWNGKLFRGIYPEWETLSRELFSSGLIDALYAKKLIPRTTITDLQVEGFALVIEHERIPSVSYPHEWSFTMLKDAGICVMEVNKLALEFGYETKDCHAYNVVFHNNHPVFVDIGSFVKTDEQNVNLLCYEEFLMDYYHPLKIWQKDYYTAKRIIADETGLLPHFSYYKIKYGFPFNRLFYYSDKGRKGLFKLYNHPTGKKWLKPVATKRKKKQADQLIRKISKLYAGGQKSTWDNYHTEYLDAAGEVVRTTPRFDVIADLVKQYHIKSITELAGNQGVMSKIILKKAPTVEKIICTDYDENAIDGLYASIKNKPLQDQIMPVVLNFMTPVPNYFGNKPYDRFASECVLALAVTHHLILTQGFNIDTIIATIKSYTTKYAVIEFMPKGLWDGKGAPPFPEWYNKQWFAEHLSKQFTILSEQQTEENRITFFCSIN